MTQAIGIRAIRIDGVQVLMREGATFKPGVTVREPFVGPDGVHGYTNRHQAAQLDVQITDQGGQSLREFSEHTGVTVAMESENGKSYVMPDAWQGGEVELALADGAVSLVYYSRSWQETGVT